MIFGKMEGIYFCARGLNAAIMLMRLAKFDLSRRGLLRGGDCACSWRNSVGRISVA